jgi:hypothetical protein
MLIGISKRTGLIYGDVHVHWAAGPKASAEEAGVGVGGRGERDEEVALRAGFLSKYTSVHVSVALRYTKINIRRHTLLLATTPGLFLGAGL